MKSTELSMPSLNQRVNNEISIYADPLATREVITLELKKVLAAFPDISNDFIIILAERIIDNNFTIQRVKDSINNIIDNFQFPKSKISDFISFDKRVKLFTYNQIIDLVNQHGAVVWDNYKAVEIGLKHRVYASIVDIEKYNLKIK
jgi:hypothetical protein